jgi:tetratricopeptide (TPR) repeat protein
MYLLTEPAWRYFLFMGFICAYSLYRVIAPIYAYHHQRWLRIRKAAERAVQARQGGDLLTTRIRVALPVMSFEKRCRLALELLTGSMVFLISMGWGVRLLQTAIHTHRGIVAASERDEYRATKEYQLALKSNPVASKIHWSYDAMQSDADRQIGDLSTAQVYVRLHPDDAEGYNKLGSVYMRLKRYKEAIKAFRNGVMLHPNTAVLHSNLGSAYSADMQIEAAIDEFQRAIAEDPSYGAFYSNLGDVYFYKHDSVHAEEEYKNAILHNPALIQPYWRLSELLRKEGRREEAKTILQALLNQSHMPEDAVTIAQIHTEIADLK